MKRHGVIEFVASSDCYNTCCTPVPGVGRLHERGCVSFKGGMSRDQGKPETMTDTLGPDEVFSPVPLSARFNILVSTILTSHDDEDDADGPIEMAT